MSSHTKEAQEIKKKAIAKILGRMYENQELKRAGEKISSSAEPKMYLRMARLLAGTDDSVFIDEVENLLAKDADGDKLKNKLRGISERKIPLKRKRVQSDRLHHGIPLELMDVLMKQDPDIMLEFLQAAEADGRYFGDSDPNIDNSFQEQSHTGARDKKATAYRNYPYELDLTGDKNFSAHNQGTAKGFDKSLDRVYTKGTDMYEAFKPAIEEAEFSLKLGINADKSRRVVANELMVEEGLLLPGEDNWSTDMPSDRIQTNRTFLDTPEVGLEVAAAQNPYEYQDPDDLRKANIPETAAEDWRLKNQLKLEKSLGGMRTNSVARMQRKLARQGVKSLNNVPTVLGGPLLAAAGLWVVGQDPTQAAVDATPLGDLEGGTELANIEAEGNYFVNRSNNEIVGEREPTMSTEEFRNQGRQGLAYKNGQPVAIPFGSSEVGEANTGDMLRAIKDEAWAVNTQRAADMKSYATGGANDYGFTELAERTVKRGIEWIKGIPRFAITY
jgi:hypothetical protein